MSKLFFGKIPQAFKPEQLLEGFYEAPRGSSRFGSISIGDYCYIIGNDKIQFWRAKEWTTVEGNDRLEFEIINRDLNININNLIAFKYFVWNKALVVLTSRSSKTAFHQIELVDQAFDINTLFDNKIYKNNENYRSINLVEEANIDVHSKDIQVYLKQDRLQLVPSTFIPQNIVKAFRDNTENISKGSKHKDNSLIKVLNAIQSNENELALDISHRAFYDAFFCDYTVKPEVLTVTERSYFRYSPGVQASRWEDDLDRSQISISFNQFDIDLTDYTTIDEINRMAGLPLDSKSNSTWNMMLFRTAKIGDVIFATRGVNTVLGIGILEGEYVYDNTYENFKHVRKVNWISKDTWDYEKNTIPNYQNLFRPDTFSPTKVHQEILDAYVAQYPQYRKVFEDFSLISSKGNLGSGFEELADMPINQILYGPPGTGKTYHTVLKAAQIISGKLNIDYTFAQQIFKSHLYDQIEFITFHQNYSYEDFIQGIRPDTDNDSSLSFDKKDGIFKRIADRALANLRALKANTIENLPFETVFNSFIAPLINGEKEELEVKMKKSSFFITYIGEKSIAFRKNIGESEHTLSIATLKRMYDKGENDIILSGLKPYYNSILTMLLDKGKLSVGEVKRKNYVIVIDEINRANISRVFGELITLIEEDKRSEGDLPLSVVLPSGDKFIVPSNLYIIGTMNTADKSIALLDIALRRRFEFIPQYPDPSVRGVHDNDILQKINSEILKRKGHDFTIGHAYFMGSKYTLEKTINNKVVPLLLEYFMNDEKEVISILKAADIELDEWPLRMKTWS